MAEASLDCPLTPEHFECDESWCPGAFADPNKIIELPASVAVALGFARLPAPAVEAYIEGGIDGTLDVAPDTIAALIDVLDLAAGDPDLEQDDWNEYDENWVATYGIDQTDPAAFERPKCLVPMSVVAEQLDWWQADNLRRLPKVGNW